MPVRNETLICSLFRCCVEWLFELILGRCFQTSKFSFCNHSKMALLFELGSQEIEFEGELSNLELSRVVLTW